MKKLPLVVLLLIALSGCEKLLFPETPGQKPSEVFDEMWSVVNEKYTYFDLKSVDWRLLRDRYETQIQPEMSQRALFDTLATMLSELEDGHVNLISPFDLARNWDWYLNSPDNFSEDLVERHYLGRDHKIAGGLRYTILEGNIAYLYYGSFSSDISPQNLQSVLNYFANTRGLIIDIRHNGGGSLNNAYRLAEAFVDAERTYLLRRFKTGPAPKDFSSPFGISLAPGPNQYRGPVALLTNRRSYSASNTFTAILSQLPQVTHLGDTTGGGGGIPIDYELPNGWRLRLSGTRETTPSGLELEEGIPPDQPLQLDTGLTLQGIDNIIESARGLF